MKKNIKHVYYELIILESAFDHKPLNPYESGSTIAHRHVFKTEKDRDLARDLLKFYTRPYINKQGKYIKLRIITGNKLNLNKKEKKDYE